MNPIVAIRFHSVDASVNGVYSAENVYMVQCFEVTKFGDPPTERYSLNKNPAFSDVIKLLYEVAEKLWTKKGSPF